MLSGFSYSTLYGLFLKRPNILNIKIISHNLYFLTCNLQWHEIILYLTFRIPLYIRRKCEEGIIERGIKLVQGGQM